MSIVSRILAKGIKVQCFNNVIGVSNAIFDYSVKRLGIIENCPLSSGGIPDVDYDFDEALKLVNDYEGFMIFKKGAHCNCRNFDGITADAFCRIVIDQKGQPLVYMKHIYGESINIEHVKGEFDEDGWLKVVGQMGTDDGTKEWMAIIKPPVGNEPLCVDAVLTSDYEKPFFTFL